MKYTLNISFICSFVFSIIHLSLNNKLQIMKYCAQTWLRDPLLGSVLQQVFHYSALTLNVPMLETQSNQLYKQPAKHTPALPLQLQGHFCFYSSSQNAQIRPKYREKYKSIDSERTYTILVCLRLDIYSALELNNLFNPTLISIEIDYKSVWDRFARCTQSQSWEWHWYFQWQMILMINDHL